jgi:hypothetical protein
LATLKERGKLVAEFGSPDGEDTLWEVGRMPDGKLWTQRDRFGNEIYLTRERWAHIIDPDNHPEVAPYYEHVAETIRLGRRSQDPYDSNGYQYYRSFSDLPDENTHLVVCVRFRWRVAPNGTVQEEKFVTTAYFQFVDG